MFLVSGRHDGRQILLTVVVVSDLAADPTGAVSIRMEPLRALLDTGATSSSITPNAAHRIGLTPAGLRYVNTAGGMRRVPYFAFRIGILKDGAGAPFVLDEPISGSAFTLETMNFDILLGMDVISLGDLAIRRDGTWSFEF
ncbi:MAG: retropepsin-like aspartic protease [Parvularculaceae bacterium]